MYAGGPGSFVIVSVYRTWKTQQKRQKGEDGGSGYSGVPEYVMNAQIDIGEVRLQTERLVLRPWCENDLEDFYAYASVDGVGQMAGWKPHRDREETRKVLTRFIEGRKTFALEYRGKVIGSVGIEKYPEEQFPELAPEACRAVGFVLAREYWGMGLMPEALREVSRYLMEQVGLDALLCGHFLWNRQSFRVQEKCGFMHYAFIRVETEAGTVEDSETRILTRKRWQWVKLHDAAEKVRHARTISRYVEAGGVAAAVESASGKIYTGVCVDTSSSLGICAERNAIFSMLTQGEYEIRRVLAVMPDGKTGAPCGACRELMVQLMPDTYRKIEVMLDYDHGKIVTLGELTPEWWI